MVPQQSLDGGNTIQIQSDDVKEENQNHHHQHDDNSTVFGSQMVDKNSNTPYTDATQVSQSMGFYYTHKI